MKLTKRRLLLFVVSAVILALIVYALLPAPVQVELATVQRGRLLVTVDEDGKTRIKERYVVSTPLSGRLLRIELDAGDPVGAGKTLLATIEPGDPSLLDARARAQAEARVRAAEATNKQAAAKLDRAREARDFAAKEFQRAEELMGTKEISQREFDEAQYLDRASREELKAAELGVQIAQFELEQAQAALLHTKSQDTDSSASTRFEIRSPIHGRVLRVFQESSAVVSAGAQLLEVGDPGDLEMAIDILSSDAVKVRPGDKVLIEHWGGDQPLNGRVRVVEPAAFTKISALGVEEQRVYIIVDFVDPIEKRQTLGDNYRVEVRIVTWEGNNVLKVPVGALFRQGENWAVFAAQNGDARLRPVKIGHRNSLEAEVVDGLNEGDQIIVHPSDRISDGVSVEPRR